MTKREIEKLADAIAVAITKTAPLCQKKFFTLEEAAVYTGLTKSALYKMTSNREIPFSKPKGKMCFFKREDLDDWMMSNPVATNADLNAQAQAYCMK